MNRFKMSASNNAKGQLDSRPAGTKRKEEVAVLYADSLLTETTDEQLVYAFKNGDEKAFTTIIYRYKHRLTRLAWSVVHNEDDAMDIVQESFIKVYRKLHSFQGTSKLYTWLYRIVMNHSIDYVRRRPSAVFVPVDEMLREPASKDVSMRPDLNLLNKELNKKIFEAVDKLPEKQKKTVLLREVEDLSYNEIAEIMNCSVGTVMSRLYYAREKLRDILEPYVNPKS